MLGVTAISGERVPKKLSELLSGRRRGKIKVARVETFRSDLDDLKWSGDTLKAEATLHRNKGTKAWSAQVGLVLVTESGRRTELDHTADLIILSGTGCTVTKRSEKSDNVLKETWTPGYEISVPAGVTEVKVQLIGSATRLGNETIHRSRSDLAVSFQSIKETNS